MALSKKTFLFALLGLILLFGGGIAIIIIFKNKGSPPSSENLESDFAYDDELGSQNSPVKGVVGTKSKCMSWLRRPNSPWKFAGRFTKSKIATRQTVLAKSGEKIVRNAYWLTGDEDKDAESLNGIQLQACMGKIPVVVFRMRPSEGLRLSHSHSNLNYYKPTSVIETWNDYDTTLKKYLKILNNIPAIVILEPDLLMFTYDVTNHQHRWFNKKYEEEFLIRANRVISKLSRSRVYVDVGNAAYLGETAANIDQMAKNLLRLPGLRGFAINTMHYVNQTYNEFIARQLYCRTGFHYVVDTSRNGGRFSKQALPKVLKCVYDPPDVKQGQFPGWAWGSQKAINAPRLKRWINQIGSSSSRGSTFDAEVVYNVRTDPPPRIRTTIRTTTKRLSQMDRNDPNWAVNQYNNLINTRKNSGARNINDNNNNNNIFSNHNQHNRANNLPRRFTTESPSKDSQSPEWAEDGGVRSVEVATEYMRSFKSNLRRCMARKSNVLAHDANLWIKTPGESDGRLYQYGVFRGCLMGHSIPCDDSCPMFVQTDLSRDPSCQCHSQQPEEGARAPSYGAFPIEGFTLD